MVLRPGVALACVKSYEYLGLILDNKLNMHQQLDSMYKKSNMKLGILTKIRRFISEKTAVRICKTMIHPHLEYVDFIIESRNKDEIDKIDQYVKRWGFAKNRTL